MLEQDNYESPPYDTTYVWQSIKEHFKITDRYENASILLPDPMFQHVFYHRFGLLAHSHSDFNKSFYSGLAVKLATGAKAGDSLCQYLFRLCGQELGKHILAVSKDVHAVSVFRNRVPRTQI